MNNYFDSNATLWDSNKLRWERARIIAEKIRKHVDLKNINHGLDFGCGTGLLGFNFINDTKHFTFIDQSAGMIKEVRKKIEKNGIKNASCLQADICKKSITDKFDLIVSLLAFHHIDNYQEYLKILSSILMPAGYLCIADLVTEDGSFHNGQTVPHSGFNITDFESKIKKTGLIKLSTSIPYINKKEYNGKIREYPVFLTIFQKGQ